MSKMKLEGVTQVSIHRMVGSNLESIVDQVIIEAPLEIRVKHRQHVVQLAITMRTPGQDADLALGFLFTEGIISGMDEIIQIEHLDHNVIQLEMADQVDFQPKTAERNTFMSSSCGICGKASLDAIKTNTQYLPWSSKVAIDANVLYQLIDRMNGQQSMFALTGGNHAVTLFDIKGNLVQLTEDVGRHNAMDKLIGSQLRSDQLPLSKHICLLSGRASFELIQKAMMAGIGIVAAVGAPSSLAIDLAEESGMTLIGFLKSNKYNVYSGIERIGL